MNKDIRRQSAFFFLNLSLLSCMGSLTCIRAGAQSFSPPPNLAISVPHPQPTPTPIPPIIIFQPPPPQTPPPVTPPPTTPPPVHIFTPPPVSSIRPLLPTDVLRTSPDPDQTLSLPEADDEAINGLAQTTEFPGPDDLRGPHDYILVEGEPTNWRRETAALANLIRGTVLASVRKPANLGMLITPLGRISFGANSEAFVSYDNGVLRIRNIDGLGNTLKVRLDSGHFAGANAKTFAIAPGYELAVGEHQLTRAELRPADGILRRRPQLIAEGFGGISQFQVESALQSSAIVAQMTQKSSDPQERKAVGDMCKMAAVLNQLNGYEGFAQ